MSSEEDNPAEIKVSNIAGPAHPRLREIAQRLGVNLAQVVFAFAQQVGMIALTGTTSAEHMTTDLEAQKLKLEATEIADIERLIA